MSRWEKIEIKDVKLKTLKKPGVYYFWFVSNTGQQYQYVGSTISMESRINGHRIRLGKDGKIHTGNWGIFENGYLKISYEKSIGDWLMREYRLIVKLTPNLNQTHCYPKESKPQEVVKRIVFKGRDEPIFKKPPKQYFDKCQRKTLIKRNPNQYVKKNRMPETLVLDGLICEALRDSAGKIIKYVPKAPTEG